MKYSEIKGDLFKAPKSFYLAHCIASDLIMGAGIAVPMNKKFKIRQEIYQVKAMISHYDKTFKFDREVLKHPNCVLTGKVFNLITKSKSYHKPTYDSLIESLRIMKDSIYNYNEDFNYNIKKIAMPKIGCGLDRLQWGRVREIIKEIFDDVDIEIRVYYL